jgi:hypothetical protein
MSLLRNDFQIQPLDSMAVRDRRGNSLFPKHLFLTFMWYRILPKTQQKCTSKRIKTTFLLNPAGLSHVSSFNRFTWHMPNKVFNNA